VAHLERFDHSDTHRLIPNRYVPESVLETLPLPADVLSDLSELDAATNERKLAQSGQNPLIGREELLFGVPHAMIVNAAFSHPGSSGGRFNSPQRGAWYAGVELETSVQEVAFHKRRFLEDTRFTEPCTFDYVDYLADFFGEFHCLDQEEIQTFLQPDPVPQCYAESQALANKLLYEGSNGIVYPSVRHRPDGICIACFRPALVFHPRRGEDYKITVQSWTDKLKVST
jgi:RES domain-containing protein